MLNTCILSALLLSLAACASDSAVGSDLASNDSSRQQQIQCEHLELCHAKHHHHNPRHHHSGLYKEDFK